MAYDSTLMRLPDPTTNPPGPGFVSVGMQNNKAGMSNPLNSGGTISVQFAGAYWTINIAYPELTIDQADQFFPILDYLTGGFTNFYVQIPMHVNPKNGIWNTANSTLIAQGAITAGSKANEIVVPSWNLRGGTFVAGDMLKFTNSHKIYRVAYTSLVSQTMTIGLNCDILERTKLATAGFEPNDIKFRVRAAQIELPQITARGVYSSFNLSLRENIL